MNNYDLIFFLGEANHHSIILRKSKKKFKKEILCQLI